MSVLLPEPEGPIIAINSLHQYEYQYPLKYDWIHYHFEMSIDFLQLNHDDTSTFLHHLNYL